MKEKENKHFIPRSIKTNLLLLFVGGFIVYSGIFKSEDNGLLIMLNFIAIICFIVGIIGVIRWFIVGRKNKKGLEELEKLSELKEKGVITQEEFEAKKKQILGL